MKIKQTGYLKKKKAGVSPKLVCFNCRKCFHKNIPHCVECQGIAYNVGNFFTAPKKNNLKQWKILEKMVVQLNYKFSKYGATGYMPCSIQEADLVILRKIASLDPVLYSQGNVKDISGKIKPLFRR